MIFFYGTVQFIKLYSFDETAIMHSSRDSYFKGDEIIESHLQFAYALTTYDDIEEVEEDPTYATLRGEYRLWGWEGLVEEYNKPLDFHPCTDEELGIEYDASIGEHVVIEEDRSKTRFFMPREQSHYDLTQYRKKFRCLTE